MADRSNPYLLIGMLVICVIASGVMCSQYSTATDLTMKQIQSINGSTVVSGDDVVDLSQIQKIPIAAQPGNIIRPLLSLDLATIFTTFTTGTAPKDVIGNGTFVTNDGKVSDKLKGPGFVSVDKNGKLSIVDSDHMVWGQKLPYTVAVKEGDSVKFVENGTTTKTIKATEISNDTVPTDFVSAASLQSWFNSSKEGENITVDYYLGNFSDNRSAIYGKDNIIHAFGEQPYNYMRNYLSDAPVMVYDNNATKTNVSSGTSVLGVYAEYPTETRAANAREFARGWNGTIIPPHQSAHGKENVTFTSISEAEAPSGSATHGVCPAGRSLREAVLALGNPLPVGMSSDEEAILYEYRPTMDVLVSNEGDYPILIEMWTDGEGGGTTIYTTIYELRDNNTYVVSSSNSTVNETTAES
ncbi:MAG: hypothetical protein E7Z86_09905 [Methanosphaera stadtmanae]|jgi:hypothetical protein|nr:hypothetical protein [Methanosphaera stadtmanae]